VVPAMIAYLGTRIYRWSPVVLVLLASPILATLFFLGSRFPLLFSTAGFVMVLLPRESQRGRALFYVGAMAVGLLVASVLMARVRGEGYHQLGEGDVLSVGEGPLIHFEGCVAWLAFLMRYVDTHGFMYGRSIGGILLFWIPRALWEDKPTLIGYWLPRTIEEGYAGGHSVSLTFSGDAFADFGFAGGVAVCFVLGLLFGRLERWTRRQFDQGWQDPKIVIAAVIYGATYLSVRSVDASLISMVGVVSATYLLRFFVLARRTPAVTSAPAETIRAPEGP